MKSETDVLKKIIFWVIAFVPLIVLVEGRFLAVVEELGSIQDPQPYRVRHCRVSSRTTHEDTKRSPQVHP